MKLSFNVGGLDRVIRITVGIVLAAIAYFGVVSGVYAILAYIFAAIAFVTGIVKFCPAYAIFGISSCKAR
jgi:hypothetical protein